MFKRIFLFAAVNLLVIVTLNFTLTLLGVNTYMDARGIQFDSLLVFCSVFGFGGAFISLLISKWMAKMSMGVQVIDPSRPGTEIERKLVERVHAMARGAGLTVMPEVGIYPSGEINAFATGPSKSNSLVAVSEGLLRQMDSASVEGVLAHEVAHIANGDMVTMTLIQGVINTFVMFFSRIAAWAVTNAMAGDRDRDRRPSPWMYWIITTVFEVLFSFLGMIVVAYFSRYREFRADKGGAKLAGKDKMIRALESLKSAFGPPDNSNPSLSTLKINGKRGGLLSLLSTHPDLDSRIEALRRG